MVMLGRLNHMLTAETPHYSVGMYHSTPYSATFTDSLTALNLTPSFPDLGSPKLFVVFLEIKPDIHCAFYNCVGKQGNVYLGSWYNIVCMSGPSQS